MRKKNVISVRRTTQRGGNWEPEIYAVAGQAFVIGDIFFLAGEESAEAIQSVGRPAGIFLAQGQYPILFIRRRNDEYPFRNGRKCVVSMGSANTSRQRYKNYGTMGLMATADYEALGGSPHDANANQILEFIAPEDGVIRIGAKGFTINGTLLC